MTWHEHCRPSSVVGRAFYILTDLPVPNVPPNCAQMLPSYDLRRCSRTRQPARGARKSLTAVVPRYVCRESQQSPRTVHAQKKEKTSSVTRTRAPRPLRVGRNPQVVRGRAALAAHTPRDERRLVRRVQRAQVRPPPVGHAARLDTDLHVVRTPCVLHVARRWRRSSAAQTVRWMVAATATAAVADGAAATGATCVAWTDRQRAIRVGRGDPRGSAAAEGRGGGLQRWVGMATRGASARVKPRVSSTSPAGGGAAQRRRRSGGWWRQRRRRQLPTAPPHWGPRASPGPTASGPSDSAVAIPVGRQRPRGGAAACKGGWAWRRGGRARASRRPRPPGSPPDESPEAGARPFRRHRRAGALPATDPPTGAQPPPPPRLRDRPPAAPVGTHRGGPPRRRPWVAAPPPVPCGRPTPAATSAATGTRGAAPPLVGGGRVDSRRPWRSRPRRPQRARPTTRPPSRPLPAGPCGGRHPSASVRRRRRHRAVRARRRARRAQRRALRRVGVAWQPRRVDGGAWDGGRCACAALAASRRPRAVSASAAAGSDGGEPWEEKKKKKE